MCLSLLITEMPVNYRPSIRCNLGALHKNCAMAGEETYGLTVLHDANFNFTTQEKNHSSSVVLFE